MTLKILIADGLAEAGVNLLKTAGDVTVSSKITAAELLAADRGLGFLITMGRKLALPDMVLLGMIMIGAVIINTNVRRQR